MDEIMILNYGDVIRREKCEINVKREVVANWRRWMKKINKLWSNDWITQKKVILQNQSNLVNFNFKFEIIIGYK